jgi:hypothetical protein
MLRGDVLRASMNRFRVNPSPQDSLFDYLLTDENDTAGTSLGSEYGK